ncbi:MAG: isochorismate synthase [Actinomycetota bacterium]|nr:isochorismate synthase [Actinomycetota bacterium]
MHAVVRRADDVDIDLTDIARADGALFVRDGVGVAGRGVVARLPADDAVKLLGEMDVDVQSADDSDPGAGPIAIGWVPYRPGEPGEMIVPATVVRAGPDGRRWLTTIDGAADELAPPAAPAPAAAAYGITPVTPVEQYLAAVARVRDAVRAGTLTKAVIAREIAVTADHPIDVHGVLRRLESSFGSSYRFAVDGFVGASPELLVEIEGRTVRSYPLAGTASRSGDVDRDAASAAALLASTKNQVEHRIVIDVIHDTLLPWCSYLDWEPEPAIITVANVQHLGTRMEGQLSAPPPTVVELVRALTPTPALGGHPRDDALAMIDAVEGVDRDRYGGAVGWVDAAGNGTWAVAIRCAELSPDRCTARLWAGGGIVADSDPLTELAETQAKFQAMLSALIRP